MNGSFKTVQWAMSQKWCLLLFKCCSMRMLKLSFDNRLGASRKLSIFHQWSMYHIFRSWSHHAPIQVINCSSPPVDVCLHTVIMGPHYFIIEFTLQTSSLLIHLLRRARSIIPQQLFIKPSSLPAIYKTRPTPPT